MLQKFGLGVGEKTMSGIGDVERKRFACPERGRMPPCDLVEHHKVVAIPMEDTGQGLLRDQLAQRHFHTQGAETDGLRTGCDVVEIATAPGGFAQRA